MKMTKFIVGLALSLLLLGGFPGNTNAQVENSLVSEDDAYDDSKR